MPYRTIGLAVSGTRYICSARPRVAQPKGTRTLNLAASPAIKDADASFVEMQGTQTIPTTITWPRLGGFSKTYHGFYLTTIRGITPLASRCALSIVSDGLQSSRP